MFDPMAMVLGLVLAQQRGAADPLTPALISGVLPMPMGLVAAVLLTDRSAPVAPAYEVVSFDDQLAAAITGLNGALTAKPPDPAAITAAQRQLASLVVAASELPDDERAKLQSFPAARDLFAGLVAALDPRATGVMPRLAAATSTH